MAVLLRALRELFPVLRLRAWMLSGMIILGVLAALSEGLSISLFIPLVQNQIGDPNCGYCRETERAFPGNSPGAPAFVGRFQHIPVHGAKERAEL